LQTILQRADVVEDLVRIGLRRFSLPKARQRKLTGFIAVEVRDIGLRAFDARGKHSFATHKGAHQELGIRHCPPQAAELSQRKICFGQGERQLGIPDQQRW
jgi:hypothetical protein